MKSDLEKVVNSLAEGDDLSTALRKHEPTPTLKGWRIHNNHRSETKAVKEALRNANIPFRKVSHGTGTAWAWLNIYLGNQENYRRYAGQALIIAQGVTGRHGEYHGEILILAQ